MKQTGKVHPVIREYKSQEGAWLYAAGIATGLVFMVMISALAGV